MGSGDLYEGAISAGDYITSVEYWPFVADWESYLACGIRLRLNSGNVIPFDGTFYTDSRYCGTMQTFSAGNGQMVSAHPGIQIA